MIRINGIPLTLESALELLSLAREIARTEHISHREALRKAIDLLPDLREDASDEAAYLPARFVLFDDTGQPHPATAGLRA